MGAAPRTSEGVSPRIGLGSLPALWVGLGRRVQVLGVMGPPGRASGEDMTAAGL